MLIEVICPDCTEGVVEDYLLQYMIKSGKIAAFRRSSGWVVIGSQPIREDKAKYSGPERRKAVKPREHRPKVVAFRKGRTQTPIDQMKNY